MTRPTARLTFALAAVALTATGLTACGSSSGGGTTASATGSATTSTVDQAAAALLPATYKGGIRVASDQAYAPIDFKDVNGDSTGLDYDLGQILGAKLGTKVTFTNVSFDGIIPALQADKYDLVMSAMSDTKERQKVLTFVDYYTAGTSFVVAKGNPKGIKALTDLCGKHAAVEKGTTQETVIQGANTQCGKDGKPAITIDSLPTDAAAQLEIRSGKADADVNDSPVASYIAEQSGGAFEAVLIDSLGTAPYGIGTLRANGDLAKALQAALRSAIADGSYQKVLDKYGIGSGALTTAAIDGGTS